jgi:hypothetical protein
MITESGFSRCGLTKVLTEGVRAKLFVSIELKQTINRSP